MFKKLKLFFSYSKTLSNNRIELEQKYNIRIDNARRLYTVINIPEEIIGEAYSLKKSDIDKISENFLRQYSSELGTFLDSKGLKELYDVYDIKKVDKYSYLIVYGFSLFKSQKFYNRLYIAGISTGVISLIILLFLIF
jgi:hypothetical protein